MKKILILLCLPLMTLAQQTYVPDDYFEAYLESNGMGNGIPNDDYVTTANINTVDTLMVSNTMLTDLTGIEGFTALTYLYCIGTTVYFLTNLDVSQNTALKYLNCRNNQLTSLDVSQNPALISLNCNNNQLTSLDVSQNTALDALTCTNNQLTILDVSNNTALTYLYCAMNQLTILDVSNNTVLDWLHCTNNQLTNLDVSGATALRIFYCNYNQLTLLDVSQNTGLDFLECLDNQLTSLDVSQNTVLTGLGCSDNQLTSLDLRNCNNTNMWAISCDNNSNLFCIDVDDSTWSVNGWGGGITMFDSQHYFSNNCSGLSSWDCIGNVCTNVGSGGQYNSLCSCQFNCIPSAIEEHTTNKELLRTIDVLGRETKSHPLFYIYDDGTVEKRIVIE